MLHSKVLSQAFSSSSVYIVAGKRTPIGSFLGKLSKFKATELSSLATEGALKSINLDPSHIDEVILGNVIAAGQGQSPARQASLGAKIPVSAPCTLVNKVCASGLKALVFGAQSIQLGHSRTVLAGGFESMSQVPFYVTGHRSGQSYGNQTLIDGIAHDGLTDVYNKIAMGLCAEKTVADFKFDRQVQDAYCITSYERTLNAHKLGKLENEIVPVQINEKELFSQDEEPLRFKKDKIPQLKPAFSKTGTITAANSSKINDGACSLILMSEAKVKELNLKPLARIVSYGDAEVSPIDFCIAPHTSSQVALNRAGMKLSAIDYFEFNEAFSATVLANMKLMDIDIDKVNVNGGAVALGHPIGMSGARIVLTLINVLKQRKGKFGIAGICNGGGGATSMIVENIE